MDGNDYEFNEKLAVRNQVNFTVSLNHAPHQKSGYII